MKSQYFAGSVYPVTTGALGATFATPGAGLAATADLGTYPLDGAGAGAIMGAILGAIMAPVVGIVTSARRCTVVLATEGCWLPMKATKKRASTTATATIRVYSWDFISAAEEATVLQPCLRIWRESFQGLIHKAEKIAC